MTMPLALVSLGQTSALLVGGFDVSVGALMTLCVVVASYTMTPTTSGRGLIPGSLALFGRRARDRGLQRDAHLRPPSSFDHRHARHVQHPPGRLAPAARPSRGVDQQRRRRHSDDERQLRAGRVRRVVILAVARGHVALPHRERDWRCGRSVSTRRRRAARDGHRRMVILAFVACSVMASIAGFYLAAEARSARRSSATTALESIAAAVLGGRASRRQRLVRRDIAGGALPQPDRQHPAAIPPADRVRGDDDRRPDPAGARALQDARAPRPASAPAARARHGALGILVAGAGQTLGEMSQSRSNRYECRGGGRRAPRSRAIGHGLPASRRTRGRSRSPSRRHPRP